MENKTEIFIHALSEYENAKLVQAEQFAADSLIFRELMKQQADKMLCPFVCMVHSNPGLDNQSFLLLFCVSYYPEGSRHIHYDYIRTARLTPDDFLDWLLVTGDLLTSNHKTQCFTN